MPFLTEIPPLIDQLNTTQMQTLAQQTKEQSFEPTQIKNEPTINTLNDDDVKQKILTHEGSIPYPYKDSRGYWTIGTGHLLNPKNPKQLPTQYQQYAQNQSANFAGNNKTPVLSPEQIQSLFAKDYKKHKKEASKFLEFHQLGPSGQAALVDLTFNMGSEKLRGFKKMLEGIRKGDSAQVETELKNSKYWNQIQDSRKNWVLENLKQGVLENLIKKVKKKSDTQINSLQNESTPLL